jgi:hypothetical protein
MSFWSTLKNKLYYRNKYSMRDYARQLPTNRKELSDYLLGNSHVRELVEKDENARAALDEAVNSTYDKYSKEMRGLTDRAAKAGHGIGYIADTWLFSTGDIVGALNLKFGQAVGQAPEKAYSLWYGLRTGNYMDAVQNVLEGIVGLVPGLTWVDEGLTRIVQKRMVSDALTRFEKEVGIYKSWTTKLYEKLNGAYTGVRDRIGNVISPEPALQPA